MLQTSPVKLTGTKCSKANISIQRRVAKNSFILKCSSGFQGRGHLGRCDNDVTSLRRDKSATEQQTFTSKCLSPSCNWLLSLSKATIIGVYFYLGEALNLSSDMKGIQREGGFTGSVSVKQTEHERKCEEYILYCFNVNTCRQPLTWSQ